jgi:hypothetical protein
LEVFFGKMTEVVTRVRADGFKNDKKTWRGSGQIVKEKTEDLKIVRRDGERDDGRPEVSQVIWLKRRRKT